MRRTVLSTVLALLVAGSVCGATPQTTNKPTRGVKGTTQMAGDNGKMGVTYTIGKGADAVNFTLLSAEYSTSRIAVQGRQLIPKAEEKLLVLHYTLHNPNPRDLAVGWNTLSFTAVDSKDVNRTVGSNWGGILSVKEGAPEILGVALKPAQKVAVMSAILLPADAIVPKLIVQRMTYQPVLRLYFKPGEIKPVAEAYRDPADQSGCTSLANVPAQMDTYYQAGLFDVKLVGTSYVDGKLGTRTPPKGQRFFVASIMVKNQITRAWTFNGFTFATAVKTNDGEKTRLLSNLLLKAQRDEPAGLSMEAGEEYSARVCVLVPVGAQVTAFMLRDGESQRIYTFPIASP